MILTLDQKKQETADTVSFIFKPSEPVVWQAGQYIKYQLPLNSADDRGDTRYFTVSSAPYEGDIRITTRLAAEKGSTFKAALSTLPVGGQIEAAEPKGKFVMQEPDAGYVFVAGGIGITPYRSILLDLAHRQQPMNIVLLYANRSQDNIPFKDELDQLAQDHPSLSIEYIIEPERIQLSHIQKAAEKLAKDNVYYYVSGPEPMVEAFEKLLLENGYDEDHLKTDFFPGYEN